jgi:hypothetical protein
MKTQTIKIGNKDLIRELEIPKEHLKPFSEIVEGSIGYYEEVIWDRIYDQYQEFLEALKLSKKVD